LRYTWILIAAAAVYSGLTLYSRWHSDRRAERQRQQEQLEADRRAVEMLGGARFDILHFYASPPAVRRGEAAQLCYGVSNAKAVRLNPPDGAVWPSHNRCLSLTPTRTTTYTLTIEDAGGHTRTASLTLQVQ
jgi:hypothetical protein